MPDTPLNPDALAHAKDAGVDCRINGGSTEDVAECAVEAYLAVAQPELQANSKPNQNLEFAQTEVNSVEELDQLPMHSYVQGNDGFKHAKDWNGGWHLIVNRPSSAPHLSESIELPALLLYRPEVKP